MPLHPTLTRLDSGLRVITDPMPDLESFSLGIWVRAGSRHESAAEHGIAHLLEHMAFKGTARRTAQQLAEQIEDVGGYHNAYTSRSQTVYYIRGLKNDLPLAMDILGDILINPRFEPEELAREQGVVLQEIGQAEDTPDDIIFDHLQALALPDQGLGRPILGTRESVTSHTPEGLRRFMGRHYRTGNSLVVASGAVDSETVTRLAEQHFTGLPGGDGTEGTDSFAYGGGERRENRDLEQLHVALAFPGVGLSDPAYFASLACTEILGGGMSSRLFQEVRERRGLAYSVYSFTHSYVDGGLVGIYAGTGEEAAGDLLAVLIGEVEKLSRTVTEAEVARAKAQIRSGLLMGLESPSERSGFLAHEWFTRGKLFDAAVLEERLAPVDAAAVGRFAEKLMACPRPSLAALGPVGGLEPYDRFAARFGR